MKSPALLLRRARRQLAALDETLAKLEPMLDPTSLDAGPLLPGRPSNGRWSADDDTKMLRLIERGVSHERIATVLGRTTLAVSQRVSRLRKAAQL